MGRASSPRSGSRSLWSGVRQWLSDSSWGRPTFVQAVAYRRVVEQAYTREVLLDHGHVLGVLPVDLCT
jgi:hypothetical protein